MPYRLVGWSLPIKAMRMPDRFNVALSLPLAVLVGYGVMYFQEGLKRHFSVSRQGLIIVASSVILAGIILFEYMSIPLRTTAPLDSPFYRQLARETGDFAILDVPMGRGYSKAYMFLQTLHGKRLVEGHISRTPSEAYNYIRNQPLLRSLAEQDDLDTSRCDLSRRLEVLAADDIRYIVIHKVDVPQDRLTAWRNYFTARPVYEDDSLLVYRTHPLLGQDFEPVYTLGGRMALVQVTVTPTQTTPGGVLWVELRWTTTYTPTGDYMANLALVNPAGIVVQEEAVPLCNDWPTSNWGRDALVVDQRQFQISPYLPTLNYQLDLSIVEAKTGQVLPPAQTIATVEVEAWERRFVAPPMQRSTTATFGETLTLLGYDLHHTSDTLYLTLHWQALRRPDYYKVFVHLYDAQNGNLVRQSDTVPRQWTYPTNWWEAGEVVSDEILFDLSGLPAGRYRLAVGVYEPDTGTRLPLPSGQDHLTLEELSLP